MLHTGSKICRTRRLPLKAVTYSSYARRLCSPEGRYEKCCSPEGRYENGFLKGNRNLSRLRPKAKCSPKAVTKKVCNL